MFNYLFVATYKDGSKTIQTQDDKSETTEGKNAFFDVLQRIEDVDFFTFQSHYSDDYWTVDLKTGAFEHNGVPFLIGDPQENVIVTRPRLVYFRRVKRSVTFSGEQLAPTYIFFMGWQANDADGKNIKQTIAIG